MLWQQDKLTVFVKEISIKVHPFNGITTKSFYTIKWRWDFVFCHSFHHKQLSQQSTCEMTSRHRNFTFLFVLIQCLCSIQVMLNWKKPCLYFVHIHRFVEKKIKLTTFHFSVYAKWCFGEDLAKIYILLLWKHILSFCWLHFLKLSCWIVK